MSRYYHSQPRLEFNVRMTDCWLDTPLLIGTEGENLDRVPAMFHSDGASVPRWAHWAIGRWGCHTWAALWHDWMYAEARAGRPPCTRAEADRRLYRMARDDGMHLRTALIMWLAVRLFGAKNWRAV